jgi:hypothetical protein
MRTHLLIAALALALPGVADARKVTYYSDRDHDGHAVKRTANVSDYHHGGYYGGHGGYYGGYGGYYGGYRGYRPYYGGYRSSYYGSPYGYGYGYGGYPYYYGSPGISFSYSSGPRYYESVRTYSSATSSLEVDVQRALKRRGYYTGAIDGDIGPGSREAIRAYQADRGLSVTGRIDNPLLRSLGI